MSLLTAEGKVLRRLVDVVVAPDGSLLSSDDEAASTAFATRRRYPLGMGAVDT